jgi:hypothetical protein
MLCPECKAEYRPGFTECYDCSVNLVYELPPEELEVEHPHVPFKGPEADLVAVYSTYNPADAMLIKSLLDSEEIVHNFQGEMAKGVGVFIAPTMLFVAKGDARRVMELLQDHGIE